MKIIKKEQFKTGRPIAQGEIVMWPKEYAPKGILKMAESANFKEVKADKAFILGHSETGAHHVLERAPKSKTPFHKVVSIMVDKANETFVELKLNEEMLLTQDRQADAHEQYLLPAGDYIKVSRFEQTLDGWRVSRD